MSELCFIKGLCKFCKSLSPAKHFSSPGLDTNLCHSTPGINKQPLNLARAAYESWRQGEVRKGGRPKWGTGTEMNSVTSSSSLIPVGSLAVLDTQVEKIENQKLYMSCIAQSRDKQTVYAKCSGKDPHPQAGPATTQPTTKGKGRTNDLVPSWGLALLGVDWVPARDMDEEKENKTKMFS